MKTLTTRRLQLVPDESTSRLIQAGARQQLPAAERPCWANFTILAEDGPVGTCGLLFRDDGGIEIGYRIAPEHRRRGYALEALGALVGHMHNDLAVDVLEADVAEDNAPSRALLQRLGFQDTGVRRRQWSSRRQAYIDYELFRWMAGQRESDA
jgi:RimJ/RimL family protein N-acetyltransferase